MVGSFLYYSEKCTPTAKMEAQVKIKFIRFGIAVMFILAGVTHIIFSTTFTEVIPDTTPFKSTVNLLVAFTEIVLGSLYFTQLKTISYKLSFILLLVYIWPHIHFIQIGSCLSSFCIAPWIAWLRLMIIQPLLIYFVYYLLKNDRI